MARDGCDGAYGVGIAGSAGSGDDNTAAAAALITARENEFGGGGARVLRRSLCSIVADAKATRSGAEQRQDE